MRQSKRIRVVVVVLVAVLAQACSLIVSTDGLSGGSAVDASSPMPSDGAPAGDSGGAAEGDASNTVVLMTTRAGALRVNAMTAEFPAAEINAGSAGNSASKQTGIRFADVRIPKGAVIAGATLRLVASENHADLTTKTTLGCELADNAAPWTGTFADYDARPRGRRIPWPVLEPWAVGEPHVSADFAAALQEVVDRPGWVSGNAVVVFWANDGSPTASQRVAYAAGTSAVFDPVLTVRLR